MTTIIGSHDAAAQLKHIYGVDLGYPGRKTGELRLSLGER
jgi:hypothetical protein